eukprot:1160646-Pelagomonas_calceolata.AAC.4
MVDGCMAPVQGGSSRTSESITIKLVTILNDRQAQGDFQQPFMIIINDGRANGKGCMPHSPPFKLSFPALKSGTLGPPTPTPTPTPLTQTHHYQVGTPPARLHAALFHTQPPQKLPPLP